MAKKVFCAGFYDGGLILSVITAGKVIAERFVEGYVSDARLDESIIAEAVRGFFSDNKVNFRRVSLFVKTSKMMTRIRDIPHLTGRDLNGFKKHNLSEFFPVLPDGFVTGMNVAAYANERRMIVYAVSFPEEMLFRYVAAFHEIGIKVECIYTLPELILRSLGDTFIAAVENGAKASIILYDIKTPKTAVRDIIFSEDSFISDFESILRQYDIKDVEKYHLFGGRFLGLRSYFAKTGVFYDEREILKIIAKPLTNMSCLNILPQGYKNKLKTDKAVKVSVICVLIVFLCMVFIAILFGHIKFALTERILYLSGELKNEAFIISEAAAEDIKIYGADTESDYAYDAVYESLIAVSSCLPSSVRLTKLEILPARDLISVTGTAKTGEALLNFIDTLSGYGDFKRIELMDVKCQDSAYFFSLTFYGLK